MCPPLLKTCSLVTAQFNSLWRQRLTSVTVSCVLTEDVYRRLWNLRRVFLRFGTVFNFRSIWGFVSFGKWRIFLTVWCKNWCEGHVRFQLHVIILSINCFKFFFSPYYLSYLAGVQNMSEICLYNDCSSGPSCSKSGYVDVRRIKFIAQLLHLGCSELG